MGLIILTCILTVISQSYGSNFFGGVQSASQYESSSYESESVQVNYEQEWSQLYQVPLFRQVCNLGSGVKSRGITQKLAVGSDLDYYSLFNDMYRRNSLFQNYIFATTGIVAREETDLRRFFSIVRESPAELLRSVSLFARHPAIFKSPLINIALTRKSSELVQVASASRITFDSYQDNFRILFRSRHYRRRFLNIFGCGENDLFGVLRNAFTRNSAGTLLLLRHVISRRKLYGVNDYLSLNYNVYSSSQSIFRRKAWRHNRYFPRYQQITRQVTISQTTSTEETVHEHQAAATGIQGTGLDGSLVAQNVGQLSRSRTTKTTTTTTINYQEQWPSLYEEPLFRDICNLESNYRSQQISQKFAVNTQYNYESIFPSLLRRSSLFQRYIFASLGIGPNDFEGERLFPIIRENPSYFLRVVGLFARHPPIFKNDIANLVFSESSLELLQDRRISSITFEDQYLGALTSSVTYRKLFARVFGCGSKVNAIRRSLRRAFSVNRYGTLLLVKHVLIRRSLFSYEDYMSVNMNVYSTKRDFWGRKSWRHNIYYSKYYGGSFRSRRKRGKGLGRFFKL